MPFGVGNDMPGQSPAAAQGWQQQLAQLQQQAPGILQRLQDPNYLQQAATRLATQLPAPPDFSQMVGSGTPGPENAVGLPQGVRPPMPQMNQPAFAPDPFAFPNQPPAVSQALSAQQQAAQIFGGQPGSPAAAGGGFHQAPPQSNQDYLQALIRQRFAGQFGGR